jgi:(p)ppGpp synthase/HD superfamily hydrolase
MNSIITLAGLFHDVLEEARGYPCTELLKTIREYGPAMASTVQVLTKPRGSGDKLITELAYMKQVLTADSRVILCKCLDVLDNLTHDLECVPGRARFWALAQFVYLPRAEMLAPAIASELRAALQQTFPIFLEGLGEMAQRKVFRDIAVYGGRT